MELTFIMHCEMAAEYGHLYVVKYLVEEQRADVHACNGYLEIVKYIQDKKKFKTEQ